VATEITEEDRLGGALPGTPTLERATLQTELKLGYNQIDGTPAADHPTVRKTVHIVGPGDITGIKPHALIRTYPRDREGNFEHSGLAYIEFYEEDFPWRYTPAKATAGHKLRPWITLIVLKASEYEYVEVSEGLPFITLAGDTAAAVLPPHDELWAWAHVQVAETLATASGLDDAVQRAPDGALARLVCPRHLEPETAWRAFVVPTFETGRLRGLGEDPAGIPAQQSAWNSAAMPASATRPFALPVYHSWTFLTGQYGDFESLVRILRAGPAGDTFGKRAMDVASPGFGLTGAGTVAFEGALRPPGFSRQAFPASPGPAMVQELSAVLDLTDALQDPGTTSAQPFNDPSTASGFGPVADDPIITPPIYGGPQVGVQQITPEMHAVHTRWLCELNLDPRYRGAAGLGTHIVQRNQEALMASAWRQISEVNEANQKMRAAEFSMVISDGLYRKRVRGANDDRLLTLTAPMQRGIRDGATTVFGRIRGSRIPQAVQDPAFRRLTRPARTLVRRLTETPVRFATNMVGPLNTTGLNDRPMLSSALPVPIPGMAVSVGAVTAAVQDALTTYEAKANSASKRFIRLLHEAVLELTAGASISALRNKLIATLGTQMPPPLNPEEAELKAELETLSNGLTHYLRTDETATVRMMAPVFEATYGDKIDAKSYRGVLLVRHDRLVDPVISSATDEAQIRDYQAGLSGFVDLTSTIVPPAPAPKIADLAGFAQALHPQISPRSVLANRVRATLGGLSATPTAGAPRLPPVMAHPRFSEPQFDALRALSSDYIIPNYADLEQNSLTLMENNSRFIESFMVGLNHEMARELLWREYPTDQRGTCFQKFWHTRDNQAAVPSDDIGPIARWAGRLGAQGARDANYIVLVIRGQLLEKYPNTLVFAHKAQFVGDTRADLAADRIFATPSDASTQLFPEFQAELEPDIAIFGFRLSVDEVRGHRPAADEPLSAARPGWFFAFQERPGQVCFGLDELSGALPALSSWNELHWDHLSFEVENPHIRLSDNPLTLTPGATDPAIWATSSADMASILLQNPILFARHGEEMLPPEE
jgi:hypothetical protein